MGDINFLMTTSRMSCLDFINEIAFFYDELWIKARLGQRESTALTRPGSLVRSQHCPLLSS